MFAEYEIEVVETVVVKMSYTVNATSESKVRHR
jgi:hypothetical protein